MIVPFPEPFEVDVLRFDFGKGVAQGRVRVIAISEIEGGWFTSSRSRFLCVGAGGMFGWVDVTDCTYVTVKKGSDA